ncbi:ABC transporter substrate-binding protein [Devosia nitrariae]|uniref:sn-glycerol-3-phosphate-binding periplasmic protein UgpB n=1 Tax=Devosia nitrariae TaxID=2071872 RepID=A0ABQ5W8Y3_9HYPH|nr:sugar ABC transporter substrate-binding protein [Devosia nitrariae]GLQ56198.1 sugar ABC transporter substrate-binding protein [Devosia nitrariae]
MSRYQAVLKAGVIAAGLAAAGTGGAMAQDCAEQVDLTFTFWGSASEKNDMETAIRTFNESHPCITVTGQHIPNTGYVEKITSMLASNTAPDVAYLSENQAFAWAAEGRLLDLSPYLGDTPEDIYLKNSIYRVGDTLMGTGLATGVMLIYYNKDVFDAAGVEYPPAKAEDAWTWDEFVENARLLTKDRSGNTAADPEFDPNNIDVFGVAMPAWWAGWYPFVVSNGGDFANEEGTELTLNSPEAVEALQAYQDLIYTHHVTPTPTQTGTLPAADILMQSRKVAMSMDGMWRVTDFNDTRMNWGIGVLPVFDTPYTPLISTPKVIFAQTEHPDEAFEFYQYVSNPEEVGLFKSGLWAPLELTYFTTQEGLDKWVTSPEGEYPPEALDAIVDYSLNHTGEQVPPYQLRNIGQIFNDAVNPAITKMLDGTVSAQEAMDEAVANAASLMQGRW